MNKIILFIVSVITLIIVALAGVAVGWQFGKETPKQVLSFEDCVASGSPVMESYPRQCKYGSQNFIENTNPSPIACTQEAKLCPDGSAVGRAGPNCEFSACPAPKPDNGTSGIKGVVLLGPTCPGGIYPYDPACDDKPYSATLAVIFSGGTQIIKQFISNSSGEFSVNLPAGEYVISSMPGAGVFPICSSRGTIKVEPSKYTQATVNCDTGIR